MASDQQPINDHVVLVPYHAFKPKGRRVPLSWRHGNLDGKRVVTFVCQCGDTGPMLLHEIANDGKVTPSVVHDKADGGCGFHAMLMLSTYPEGRDWPRLIT